MTRHDPQTILHVLQHWAADAGSHRAFVFLRPDEATDDSPVSVTFGELYRRTQALALHLQTLCRPGDRVLLLHPPGLDYVVALLATMYAGAIAVPAYLPRRRTAARVLGIARDAEPVLALTVTAGLEPVDEMFAAAGLPLACVATDGFVADDTQAPGCVDPDAVALLQYTSGSTGTPRGVRVTHRALLANQRMIRDAFGTTHDDRVVGWPPIYHDMGLVGTVLHPLFMGIESVLMSPACFLGRPSRWLETISQYRANISGGPDSAFALCVDKVGAEAKARLDLSTWRVAFNGSERVRPDTMQRFSDAFSSCGFDRRAFSPCYGLAEATLIVSGGRAAPRERRPWVCAAPQPRASFHLAAASHQQFVGCGRPVRDTEVIIVEPISRTPVPEGCVGEIWVSGPAVACGYWCDRDHPDPAFDGRLPDRPETRFLRTGDLGFMSEGLLYPAGRLKDLIIIRGVNYFAEDLEQTATASHTDLAPNGAAAFAVDDGRCERAVIVVEARRRFRGSAEEVVLAIRRAIAGEHQIAVDAVVLIEQGTLPRTSSGKTRRRETCSRYTAGTLQVVASWESAAPSTYSEEMAPDDSPALDDPQRLASWMARQAGPCLDGAVPRIDEPLAAAGFDSLAAMSVVHRLEERLGRTVPIEPLLEGGTLLDVARAITSGAGNRTAPLSHPPAVAGNVHPLTPGQMSLWLLHQLDPSADPYHVATTVHLDGVLEPAAVRAAVDRLMARHQALRTTFVDGPQQIIHDRPCAPLALIDAAAWSVDQLQTAMSAVCDAEIDLANGPVARFVLYSLAPDRHVLLIVAHHIACDGWSQELLHRDFARLYRAARRGATATEAATPMAAYVRWQQRLLDSNTVRAQTAYWVTTLGRVTRPPLPVIAGASRRAVRRPVTVTNATALRVSNCARQLSVSPFVVCVAALQAALYHATSNTQVVFAIDSANRPHYWMREIVGMIANPLVLCGRVREDATFADTVTAARALLAEARRNQDVPFSRVVSATRPSRQFGSNPLFQIMFAYRNRGLRPQEVDGVLMTPGEVPTRDAKFDATLVLTNESRDISGAWEFSDQSVGAGWPDRLARLFSTILTKAADQPSRRICELAATEDADPAPVVTASGGEVTVLG